MSNPQKDQTFFSSTIRLQLDALRNNECCTWRLYIVGFFLFFLDIQYSFFLGGKLEGKDYNDQILLINLEVDAAHDHLKILQLYLLIPVSFRGDSKIQQYQNQYILLLHLSMCVLK
jgi:hypothetical protein